jgi:hypothetical protein
MRSLFMSLALQVVILDGSGLRPEPAATLLWQHADKKLYIGGQEAADSLAVCTSLGIRAKVCLAGTFSRTG